MTLEDRLPPDLRGPTTTIVPIAAGLSGAGVYRVERDGLRVGTADGQWAFGLALLKETLAL